MFDKIMNDEPDNEMYNEIYFIIMKYISLSGSSFIILKRLCALNK